MIGAALVALIAVATFAAYTGIVHVAGDQHKRAQANGLAQQDQSRLRGLSLSALAGSSGNQTTQQQIEGTVFTITSTSRFVSGAGAQSCTGSGVAKADVVQTTSTVTWPPNLSGHGAVVINGLVAPQAGGSLVARVNDPSSAPISGVTMSLSGGPSAPGPLITDANGCAVFAGLAGGTYTVTAAEPGYVTLTNATSATTSATVVPTQTANATFTLALAGGVSATFTTNYNLATHPSTAEQITAWSTSNPTLYNVFPTAATTYTSPVTTGNSLYPGGYTVFPGSCSGDYSSGGSQVTTVTGGGTQAVVLPLPAMIVEVWGAGAGGGEFDDANAPFSYSGGAWTHASVPGAYNNTESSDNTGLDSMSVTFTGSSVQWIGSLAKNHGQADVYLDGTLVAAKVDTYNGGTSYQQVLWSTTGLANTTHTLKVIVDGTKSHSGSGTGTWVPIDAIVVGVPQALLSTAPVVTVTDNNTGCSGKGVPATQAPATTPTQGALVDPGQQYGNLTVCASSGGFQNTATVANTNYVAGTTVNVYLSPGSSGLANGSCP